MTMMQRLFIGIAPPEDIRRELVRLQYGIDGIRWIPPENFHITLRFLGLVAEEDLPDLDLLLSEVDFTSFRYDLDGAGYFKKGKYCTHLWLRVAPDPPLMEFARRVNGKFDFGLTEKSFARDYLPHITLARPKKHTMRDITPFLEHNAMFSLRGIPAEQFHLYRSFLHQDGAEYQIIADYPARDFVQEDQDYAEEDGEDGVSDGDIFLRS